MSRHEIQMRVVGGRLQLRTNGNRPVYMDVPVEAVMVVNYDLDLISVWRGVERLSFRLAGWPVIKFGIRDGAWDGFVSVSVTEEHYRLLRAWMESEEVVREFVDRQRFDVVVLGTRILGEMPTSPLFEVMRPR